MIQVDALTLLQGAFSLERISFTVPTGEYAVLMGRSGCGKTTILEVIGGLRPILSGTINLAGRDVTNLKPAERGVGYVPQDRALFPTIRVRDQLAFSLVIRKLPQSIIARRVDELADLLEITHLLDRMPHGLSGGEAQRVALGRALSFHPSVLLLDEPLSALDEELHREMCELLRNVHQQTKVTILHITHSKGEAAALANRIYHLDQGNLSLSSK